LRLFKRLSRWNIQKIAFITAKARVLGGHTALTAARGVVMAVVMGGGKVAAAAKAKKIVPDLAEVIVGM
jgi:hypothetical protein